DGKVTATFSLSRYTSQWAVRQPPGRGRGATGLSHCTWGTSQTIGGFRVARLPDGLPFPFSLLPSPKAGCKAASQRQANALNWLDLRVPQSSFTPAGTRLRGVPIGIVPWYQTVQ